MFFFRLAVPIAILLLSALPLSAASSKAIASFTAQRAQLREQRSALREQVVADRERRAEEGEEAVRALVEIAAENRVLGQKPQLFAMVQAVRRLDSERAEPLEALVEALPPAPDETDRKASRAWDQARLRQLKKTLGPTGKLLNRSLEAGMTDLAYEFMREILTFDPDRGPLRKGLGQKKVDGVWLDPFSAQMARKGLWWHPKLGWVGKEYADRYAKGEYFDLQTQQWTTLKEANQQHANVKDPWVIRTPHIEVSGTVELTKLVEVAHNLEIFYAQIFAAYASFFTKNKADYQLIFGMMQHEPLKLWVYQDHAEYLQQNPDCPEWSGGVFKPRTETSYFFGGLSTTMYHEFTHQILHVFSGTNRSPTWLSEGIAVYTEAPTYHHGDLILGDLKENRDIQRHFQFTTAGRQMPLRRLMSLTHTTWSAAADPSSQYSAAGAMTWWCMEADNRSYRSDFIDFLRDSYLGVAKYPLWAYLGMDQNGFYKRYNAWEQGMVGTQ